jgi:FkbM family methyltransferase
MNAIAVNPDPAMCRHIVQQTELFLRDPVLIADVGARDGYNVEWKVFEHCLKAFCFEPDAEECARLNAKGDPEVRYIPTAVGRRAGTQTLYEAYLSYSTGLYPSNMEFFDRLLNRDNARVVGEQVIDVEPLDIALGREDVVMVNFMKLDAEGAELDILLGAGRILRDPRLFGILAEYRFHPEINGSPPFWQMDQFLQSEGFRLFDLSSNPQSRRDLPYPGTMDYFLPDGERFYAYTEHGQVMDGDALYFRDLLLPANRELADSLEPLDILKCAALYELYHHNDAAAELIQAFREKLSSITDCDVLLNLLTPEIFGAKLAYPQYMETYFHPDTRFAPAPADPVASPPPPPPVIATDEQVAAGAAGQVAALQAELASLRASTSWRITGPIRWLKLLLRRVASKLPAPIKRALHGLLRRCRARLRG